jgi:hypothetical protein
VAAVSLGEILRRFRVHGAPGAPAAAGVPVDRTGEVEAELEPVFSALEDAQRHGVALVAAAERDAAGRRADAVEEGHRIVAEARIQQAAGRAEAASALLAQADGERARLLAAARMEADRIGRVTAARTPALVDDVVRRVLALGAALP